jgi:hypothetical protein
VAEFCESTNETLGSKNALPTLNDWVNINFQKKYLVMKRLPKPHFIIHRTSIMRRSFEKDP